MEDVGIDSVTTVSKTSVPGSISALSVMSARAPDVSFATAESVELAMLSIVFSPETYSIGAIPGFVKDFERLSVACSAKSSVKASEVTDCSTGSSRDCIIMIGGGIIVDSW